ncbi:hypothetical protein JHN63_03375 [Streptomyces sp. MBT65]|jgi:hypothetical protein|uniref:hypothetical protein n=1 Tax=Streptomyces sp. MBT65 TaxID=1488395 RepID=UPI00190C15DA|nr:hypothetical protein [Streptomyces sp. MBT65]MBK3572879.1 hypothetical protein [Streptomyces sp. MBT65]
MRQDLHFRLERISAWCGFVLLLGFAVAFSVGHLITPMDPTENAQGVVEFLTDHQTGILACAAIMVLVVPFEYPFVVVTSMQMRRIEGGWGLLSMIQLLTGVVAPIGFFFPIAILAAAAYRPESHSPDVLYAMSDIYWLMLVGNACIFVLQVWSIGYAALVDDRAKPVFPRWFGYLNLVLGVLLIPGAFVFLTKTGPFAWNGLLANVLPTVVYFIWKIATPIVLLRAVKSEEEEAAATAVEPAELAST